MGGAYPPRLGLLALPLAMRGATATIDATPGTPVSPALAILAAALLASPASARGVQDSPAASQGVRLGPWFVLGPFDNPKGVAVDGETGVEKLVRRIEVGEPWSGLVSTFPGRGKGKIGWREIPSDLLHPPADGGPFDVGTIDLRAVLGTHGADGDNSAAYLYCAIEVESAQARRLACGSDDGLRLWLDGELRIDRGVARPLNPYEESLPVELGAGLHHLLVKVTNAGGGWSFALAERRAATREEVDAAIDRGVARLLELQHVDGSWGERQNDYPTGQTAFSVYTLLKCGVSPTHAAIRQALEVLRPAPVDRTYSLASRILAVATLHDPAERAWLEALVEQLLSWQNTNGGWAYPQPRETDLSNTQLAVFSLRAAAQEGVEIPVTVWNDAAEYALKNQESRRKRGSGAFTYYMGHASGFTGSMTAAGITVLLTAREELGDRMTPNLRKEVDPSVDAALAWLEAHWTVDKNPEKPDWHFYWLYALERVGAMLGRERVGSHDWYAEGASVLVPLQNDLGDWGYQSDTCFALLFLRRATALASSDSVDPALFALAPGDGPLRLRVRSGTPASLWIDDPAPSGGPPVARVSFAVRLGAGDWLELPAEEGRFALRHEFGRPGDWQVRAEAELTDGSHLVSSVLTVPHEEGVDPERLRYATDALRNRFPEAKARGTASSAASDGEGAARALDNQVWTRWLCAATDADPWIEIDPGKAPEVARLVFTHARNTRSDQRYANPRPTRVELLLNREKTPRVVEIDPDPLRKTIVALDPPGPLARLRVRIVAITGGELGKSAVGFAEIEAQGPGDG